MDPSPKIIVSQEKRLKSKKPGPRKIGDSNQ